MIKIVICDDDLYVIEELEDLCKRFIEGNQLNAECIPTTKPNEIFVLHPDILFLDIEMPEVDGIEVKNRLEKQDSGTFIIYVSSHPESMQEAFGKNVIGFLTKPLDVDQFELMLEKAVDFSGCNRVITFEDGSVISSENIVAIKVSGNYTDVTTTDGLVKNQRKTLKAWMNELGEVGFIRINDSYVVNCRWISAFVGGDRKVIMGDNVSLNVSIRRRKECTEKYTEFCKKMVRYL